MMWCATLVAALCGPLAQQPVVFDVVGAGQLPVGQSVMNKQEDQGEPTERNNENDRDGQANCIGLQYRVAVVPQGLVARREALTLDGPRPEKGAGDLTPSELVDALAHA